LREEKQLSLLQPKIRNKLTILEEIMPQNMLEYIHLMRVIQGKEWQGQVHNVLLSSNKKCMRQALSQAS
jgi:hypothetical protein